MLQFLKENLVLVIGTITYIIIFGILLIIGFIDEPDSIGYIDAILNRPPVYPLCIDLFQLVFGEKFVTPLLFVQLLLGILAMLYFIKTISIIFSLKQWGLFALSLIILSPYFLYSRIGNTILTEGIAYPLFVYFMSYLFRGFFHGSRKELYISVAILLLLNLTRGQFLFAIPITILMVVFLIIQNNALKKYALLLILLILIPLVSNLLDKTYHKISFGHFVATPWTGLHIAALPFFVSGEEDYMVFEQKSEQEYFKYIYKELTIAGLTLIEFNRTNPDQSRGYWFYSKNSTAIANGTIDGKGTRFFAGNNPDTKVILNDKMSKGMALPLIMNNFKVWFKFYMMNIIEGIGHVKLILLYPIFLIFSFFHILKRYHRLDIFIFLSFLMSLSNIALVAFAQPLTIYRYTIYGNFLIYSSMVILLSHRFLIASDKTK